ncbi:MAG: PepSY domain-containing protein [Acidobacteria bacterium]|nr:PepSY domain-containing protein [Acidobacteriota bacterium]
MKVKALLATLFSIMLVCGLTSFVSAQTNPSDKKPKATDRQKDNDREDDDSPEMQAKLAKKAKISPEQARKIATDKVAGTIIEEELERENGKLVYSIEIRDANQKVFDVEVDAKTGAIVNVEEEIEDDEDDDEDDDDTEKSKDAKEKPPLKP